MNVEMVVVHCATCSVTFAITEDMSDRRRKDHQVFYCPKGHNNYFPGKSDEEKLKEKLTEKEKQLQVREKELVEARDAAKRLREARLETISNYLNDQFKKGVKSLSLKNTAPLFGMKAIELKEHLDIYLPEFECKRSSNGYQIVKAEKEK